MRTDGGGHGIPPGCGPGSEAARQRNDHLNVRMARPQQQGRRPSTRQRQGTRRAPGIRSLFAAASSQASPQVDNSAANRLRILARMPMQIGWRGRTTRWSAPARADATSARWPAGTAGGPAARHLLLDSAGPQRAGRDRMRPDVLRRVMRDPRPPADLRQSERGARHERAVARQAVSDAAQMTAMRKARKKSWPWCRIGMRAFVEKVSGSRLDCR